jgi:hypothetical protein
MNKIILYIKNLTLVVFILTFFCGFTKNVFAVYTEEQSFTGLDSVSNDEFGVAMDMTGDGTRLVITADAGAAAYVFLRSDATWVQEAKLVPIDLAPGDDFGSSYWSVSISDDGDRVVVGASRDDDIANGSGSAYVFSRSGTDWTQEQKLVASDGGEFDSFGEGVAISGDGTRLIVGATDSYNDYVGGVRTGQAYVFSRFGVTWTEEVILRASDAALNDQFGDGVTISDNGDRVVVSAVYNDDVVGDSGSAYVFSRSGTDWTEEQKLNVTDPEALHNFGRLVPDSMSGDGTRIALTANRGTLFVGAVYIFSRSGTTWTQEEKIVPSDAVTFDSWGYYGASLSDDGDRVVFSSDNVTIGANAGQGAVYIFTRSGVTWTEGQKLVASDGAAEDYLANGVTISDTGSLVAVSMPWSPNKGSGEGYAYVFFDESLEPVTTHTLTYTAGANGTITGTTSQTVTDGTDGTEVTAVPNSGYRFVDWSDASTENPRTDVNVTSDLSITANFAVIARRTTSGSMSSSGVVIVIPPTSASQGTDTQEQNNQSQSQNLVSKFVRTLKLKDMGEDVRELQKYLNTHGFLVSTTGNGSAGNETTYFGLKTKASVILFQKSKGLTPDGIVGPLTRNHIVK